jgi:hypothetical protein
VGGEKEAFKAEVVVMMVVGEVPGEMVVVVVVVMMGVVRDDPCQAQHLQKRDQRSGQEEGQDERVQYAEVLAQEPAALLENGRRPPSC